VFCCLRFRAVFGTWPAENGVFCGCKPELELTLGWFVVILGRSGWVRDKARDGTSKGGFGFFVELYLLSTFLHWASASGHN
jgi:hypothetical protein